LFAPRGQWPPECCRPLPFGGRDFLNARSTKLLRNTPHTSAKPPLTVDTNEMSGM
jgi:hypothetical protein